MRRSSEKILTTHVGALPGEQAVWTGEASDDQVREAVVEVVGHQLRAGVDIVNEGELTKGGNWVTFVNDRMTGFEPRVLGSMTKLLTGSEDWLEFDQFYAAAMQHGVLFEDTGSAPDQARVHDWVCTGPIEYRGQAALEREIGLLKAALGERPASDAFLTSTAPASIEAGRVNEHYGSQEEFVFAIADALSVEYEAIAAAGLTLQVDDAWLAALWDRIGVGMGLEGYKRYCMMRVEALNHALRNVPQEQIRYHMCWGSWHGPHAHDIPLPDMLDVLLAIKAGAYLIEAANVRHEHEAEVWERVKLPEGKILAPGVVSHSTKLIEHPELVSHRIQRFTRMVGRENVIASTDCGLGLRCHPQIAWAKLKTLADGAALATKALW